MTSPHSFPAMLLWLVSLMLFSGAYSSEAEDRHNVDSWQHRMHTLSTIQVGNQRVANLLGNVLNYKFSLPELQLRKGTVYVGANSRLRRVVTELMSGRRPMKIGIVGGSISWGQGASRRGVTDWFSVVSRYVIQAFPQANVTARNGCVPGTPSDYMVMCMELSVDQDVDLVFVEYVLNDGMKDSVFDNPRVMVNERLLRRLLSLPNKPAVVYMQVPSHGLAFEMDAPGWIPFHRTMEDLYGALAQYYDVQWLSLRSAAYRVANFKKQEGFRWNQLMMEDGIHPSDGGFKVMADLSVYLIQQTVLDLIMRPLTKDEHELISEQLPLPMYPGNNHPSSSLCLHQDDFTKVVMEHDGFKFINEGSETKPKKGFVATLAGASLKINVSTWRDGGAAKVPTSIAYLKSYEHMGVAKISCIKNCECEAQRVDAHHEMRSSQVFLTMIHPSQHKECVIAVEVLDETRSGEHKFKVSGVIVQEKAAGERYNMPDGAWGMVDHASGNKMVISKEKREGFNFFF